MLDRNPRDGRQRLRLPQHPVGHIRLEANALPFADAERPRLVEDRIRDPETPETVDEPARRSRTTSPCGRARRRGLRRKLGDSLGVAEEVGRLEIDERRDCQQGVVKALSVEHDGERRLGVDNGGPHADGVQAREDHLGLGLDEIRQDRVEVATTPVARQPLRTLRPAEPARDLDVLRNVRDPRSQRNVVSSELAGPAAPVPALVRRADRVEHAGRERELLGHRPRDRGMVGDHPVHLAMAREGKGKAEPEPVQRRAPSAELADSRRRHPQASRLVVVLARLERDVVTEPLRLLVGIRMAADVNEQRRVVDVRALLLVEPEALGQPQGDQALAEDVLHRLSEAEVDAERERGDELRQADLHAIAPAGRLLSHLRER